MGTVYFSETLVPTYESIRHVTILKNNVVMFPDGFRGRSDVSFALDIGDSQDEERVQISP